MPTQYEFEHYLHEKPFDLSVLQACWSEYQLLSGVPYYVNEKILREFEHKRLQLFDVPAFSGGGGTVIGPLTADSTNVTIDSILYTIDSDTV